VEKPRTWPDPTSVKRTLPGEVELAKGSRKVRRTFLELFAGFCGLTLAVMIAFAGSVLALGPLEQSSGSDMLDDNVFRHASRTCKAKSLDWLHMAPPCRTFTKAKRNDAHGKVRTLRTKENPEEDSNDKENLEANLLANRCAVLAIQQWKASKYFSMENPWDWTLR
jgi:hypothetical protein